MGAYSAAGTVEGWVINEDKWVDLAPGYRYCICLANSTDTDVTSGELTVETADPDPDDVCKPGEFATLEIEPDCAAPIGTPHLMEGKITIDAAHPIKAHSQCQIAFPCPKRFLRVTGSAGDLDVVLVIRDMKRSGMQATDAGIWPGGYHAGASAPDARAAAEPAPAGRRGRGRAA